MAPRNKSVQGLWACRRYYDVCLLNNKGHTVRAIFIPRAFAMQYDSRCGV
ncbi:hypothetical protein [Atlantibacter sp.]|nr:hypothetical protein [Atlantibacter sp.]